MKLLSKSQAAYARFIAWLQADKRAINTHIIRLHQKIAAYDELQSAALEAHVLLLEDASQSEASSLRNEAAKTEQALRNDLSDACERIAVLETALNEALHHLTTVASKSNSRMGTRIREGHTHGNVIRL